MQILALNLSHGMVCLISYSFTGIVPEAEYRKFCELHYGENIPRDEYDSLKEIRYPVKINMGGLRFLTSESINLTCLVISFNLTAYDLKLINDAIKDLYETTASNTISMMEYFNEKAED